MLIAAFPECQPVFCATVSGEDGRDKQAVVEKLRLFRAVFFFYVPLFSCSVIVVCMKIKLFVDNMNL